MTAARKRTGLWDMANVAREEANRIRHVQDALVRHGDLEQPHAGQIAKADAFDDIADLILTIIPVKREVGALIAPIAAARARGAGHADPPPDAGNETSDDHPDN